MRTNQQKYAEEVHKLISVYAQKYPQEDDSARIKYGSMALKLPVLVKTAGLVQALAFVDMKSASEKSYTDLLEHLAKVVGVKNKADLLKQSRTDDLQGYIHLTRQTLTALDWFKRFSQSILKVKPTDSEKEN